VVLDERTTEVLLGRQDVVRPAAKTDVRREMGAAPAEGLDVVQLEPL
jgi:hypothetical protein